ncbi:VanZ family protein [Alkalibaculum bacchi]|jgi:VanZ family protein|uniref:VanZ family protein n=2 Tax=Alkalibaculum bacchi TaxID=645887 RepID=A0A366HXM6_9FIRM|nr:VanZ family protein [Alkalibaculum bacchi]
MIEQMKKRILPWALVIFWMALIFYLSHQPAAESNGLSTNITRKIAEIIEKIAPNIGFNLGSLNHIVRKNAHFFAYLVLGALVVNGVKNSGVSTLKAIRVALFICILYAISDEVHQLYIPGRSGEVKDVIIDSAGALVGILGLNSIIKNLELRIL